MTSFAARLLALAVRLLPAERRAWGDAMQADFAALELGADRRRFAVGCLRVALRQGAAWRIAAYLALEAAALGAATAGGLGGVFLAEVVALILLVPPWVWWLARPGGSLPLAPSRAAGVGRRSAYALVAGGAATAIAYIAAEVATQPAGSGGAALWTGVVMVVLAGYTVLSLALTSPPTAVSGGTMAAGAGFGAAAGLAGFALVPFNQSYAVHDPRLRAAYMLTLTLVFAGMPCAAAVVVARRSGELGRGVSAGGIAGGIAALLLFVLGLASLRLRPGLLDSDVFDKGVSWLPSEANADALSYLAELVLLPAVSLLVALLGAVAATRERRSWPFGGAVAGLASACLLSFPVAHGLFDGLDSTSFGAVGATNVSFSPDGRTLLTSNGAQVSVLWNLAAAGGPERDATFAGMAVLAGDGRTLAARGRLLRIARSGRPVRIASLGGSDPEAFSPDGHLLALDGTDGGPGSVWDVSDRRHPKRLGTYGGQWAAFSPDGRTFATSAACWWDSPVSATACGTTLWSVAGGSRPKRIATIGGGSAVFSPDGRTIATRAIGSAIAVWDIADPRHPERIASYASGRDADPPSALVFSPDGRLLAAGGGDGTVSLWRAGAPARAATLLPARPDPNGDQIGVSSTLTAAAFSRDGRTLVTVMGNDLATVWNVSVPRRPIRIAVRTRRTRGAGVVAFSPGATTVAGAAVDGSNGVSLWRVR